jgi:hypothetical protein
VVAIATTDFAPFAAMLARSLSATNAGARVELYVDCVAAFAAIANTDALDVAVIGWPDIVTRGPKRAKFGVYVDALRGGGFVYLDADVIVLEPLHDLMAIPTLAACPDDLSAAPYIPDRRRPWPSDPTLENRRYVNSGVLVIPPAAAEFFHDASTLVQDDQFWDRYILPGYLYDNHVLCALLNLTPVALHDLDERALNWQGFRNPDGASCVDRRGDHLVNRTTDQPLRLVHFAGIRDVEGYVDSLPVEIASLLDARARPDTALASTSDFLRHPDRAKARGLDAIVRSTRARASRDDTKLEWNGLPCGQPHLDGVEYRFIDDAVRRFGISSAVVQHDAPVGAATAAVLRRRGVATHRGAPMTPADLAVVSIAPDGTVVGRHLGETRLVLVHGVGYDPAKVLELVDDQGLDVIDVLMSAAGMALLGSTASITGSDQTAITDLSPGDEVSGDEATGDASSGDVSVGLGNPLARIEIDEVVPMRHSGSTR